jgi:hypothetical protein
MIMEPYTIYVNETILEVRPQKDGTFQIFKDDEYLALLDPDITDLGVVWSSPDDISEEYTIQIGETIEERNPYKL